MLRIAAASLAAAALTSGCTLGRTGAAPSSVPGSSSGPSATSSNGPSATSSTCAVSFEPHPGEPGDILAAVSGDHPGAIWAVGTHWENAETLQPVAERWDGSSWDASELQTEHLDFTYLQDVSVLAADDVWAVGYRGRDTPMALHWDGSTWSTAHMPADAKLGQLLAVDVAATHDAWAVGTAAAGADDRTLFLHYDGVRWSAEPGPRVPGHESGLRAVSIDRGDDAWAVGWRVDGTGVYRTLVERWNGSRWARVAFPATYGDAILSGVLATGGDVWVVGWSWTGDVDHPIVARLHGSTWESMSLPGADGDRTRPLSIAAVKGGLVLVGQAADEQGILRPVGFRWGGSRWGQIPVDAPTSGNGGFAGVTGLRGKGWLSVGSASSGGGYQPLVGRGC